jgi:hypothetical protein
MRRCRREGTMPVLLGLVMIGLGLFSAFASDLAWELQQFGNSLDGQVSERSDAWEWKRKFFAGFCLVTGPVLLYIGFTG